jgi:hypothetical protein
MPAIRPIRHDHFIEGMPFGSSRTAISPRHSRRKTVTAGHGQITASGTANLSASATSYYAVAMNFSTKLPNNLGMMMLAVWLILFGILTAPFLKFNFAHSGDLLALLAIVAGVLLLLKR